MNSNPNPNPSPLRTQVSHGVARLVLDAPQTRNALTAAMISALQQALCDLAKSPEVRCLVLSSSQPKVWCAGGDLNAIRAVKPLVEKHQDTAHIQDVFQQLADFPKPTLAAIDGLALAGGFGLACACDLIFATYRASFGTPEINIGAFPFMVTALASRDLPRRKMNELLLLGQPMAAQEALALGFINKLVPADTLADEVDRCAQALAAKSPLIMKLGKQALVRQRDMALGDALEFLRGQLALALSTEDVLEGVNAFFEKREPQWKGR